MKTYFGLDVINEKMVRYKDIEKLPFFQFWLESSKGSGMPVSAEGETFVWLADWEKFSELFIKTGQHRYTKSKELE